MTRMRKTIELRAPRNLLRAARHAAAVGVLGLGGLLIGGCVGEVGEQLYDTAPPPGYYAPYADGWYDGYGYGWDPVFVDAGGVYGYGWHGHHWHHGDADHDAHGTMSHGHISTVGGGHAPVGHGAVGHAAAGHSGGGGHAGGGGGGHR